LAQSKIFIKSISSSRSYQIKSSFRFETENCVQFCILILFQTKEGLKSLITKRSPWHTHTHTHKQIW
jgi:hypothetical protein